MRVRVWTPGRVHSHFHTDSNADTSLRCHYCIASPNINLLKSAQTLQSLLFFRTIISLIIIIVHVLRGDPVAVAENK
jgi:hypothetical protein